MKTEPTDRMQIVANIFAGRANPLIELSDDELTVLRRRLDAVRRQLIEPRERRDPPTLGYRGFLIFNPNREADLPLRVEVFGGAIAITDQANIPDSTDPARPRLFKDSEGIEDWLLERAAERGYAEAIAAMGGPDRSKPRQ
jgi:hypothetical protein